MVDSGISSSGFGQAGVGTEVAGKEHLGDYQALEFEVVEARLGTLAGEIGLTLQGTLWILVVSCFFLLWSISQFTTFFLENVCDYLPRA